MRTAALFLGGAAAGALLYLAGSLLFNQDSAEIETEAAPSRYAFDKAEYPHPRIVAELIGELSDSEGAVVTVDLEAGRGSERFAGKVDLMERGGHTWIEWSGEREYITYRNIGASPTGVHMVLCYENGGGTGSFGNVALFRMKTDKTFVDKRERTLLTILDAIPLGDRYRGGVVYENGMLNIGADEGRFKGMGGPRDGKPLSIPVP